MSGFSDIVYGGIDGTVSTFAVIAAGIGSDFSGLSIVILALSSVFADGLSMSVSAYESVFDNSEDPLLKAVITFISFMTFGMIPIIAYYIVYDMDHYIKYYLPIIGVLLAMFLIGLFKGYMSKASDNNMTNIIISGLRTMVIGGVISGISYYVAYILTKNAQIVHCDKKEPNQDKT